MIVTMQCIQCMIVTIEPGYNSINSNYNLEVFQYTDTLSSLYCRLHIGHLHSFKGRDRVHAWSFVNVIWSLHEAFATIKKNS